VIEHVERREEFLERLLSFIKPGGYLFLSTINRNVLSYLTTIFGAEYLLKLLPVGTHDYRLYLKPEELTEMLSGTNIIDLKGLIYNPLTGKFFLGKSSFINYIGLWQKV
jgi:2-polyprenyl-6-hydroxyphenyl methylase/3-demethylubiquinone-9 3-methyltransferase